MIKYEFCVVYFKPNTWTAGLVHRLVHIIRYKIYEHMCKMLRFSFLRILAAWLGKISAINFNCTVSSYTNLFGTQYNSAATCSILWSIAYISISPKKNLPYTPKLWPSRLIYIYPNRLSFEPPNSTHTLILILLNPFYVKTPPYNSRIRRG